MNTIQKLFNGTTPEELNSGHKILVDWDQVNASVEKAVMLRPDEVVKGYVVNDTGIMVSIGRKPGRKTLTKADEQ